MKDKKILTVKSRVHSWSCQYFRKKTQNICHLCPYNTKTVCEDCYHDSCSHTKLSPEQTDTEDKKWHQLKAPWGINKSMRSNRSTGSTDLELCHNQSDANHHIAAWQQWLEVSGEQADSTYCYVQIPWWLAAHALHQYLRNYSNIAILCASYTFLQWWSVGVLWLLGLGRKM